MGALKIKVGSEYITVRRGPRGPSGALTGEVKIWPSPVVPAGYLLCDGSAVSRVVYADLFALLGVREGAGDGSTTFNLPDYRLRSLVGAGTGKALNSNDALAEASRNARWSHSHNHTATASSSSSTSISGGIAGAYTGAWVDAANTDHNHAGPADHGSGPSGGTGATRLGPAAGHGSTATAAQAPGQVHAHGLSDPTHAHGHTIGATTTTTTTVTPVTTNSGDHPFSVVNYIIKT